MDTTNKSIFLVPDNEAVSPKYTHPTQPNWITVHAIASELSLAETDRLWCRFQQLGCNKDGEITEAGINSTPVSNDVFSKSVLRNFIYPKSKKITFQNFLRGLKWMEASSVKEKLQGIFRMLKNGQPVPKGDFVKILEKVYTNPQDKKELDRVANTFYKSMDTNNKGQFTEEQFINGMQRNIPQETLEELLTFEILPNRLKEELHQNLPEFRTESPLVGDKRVSNNLLKQVADLIYKKDWQRLGNKLGFTSEDVDEIRAEESDPRQQALQMLNTWKRREREKALTSIFVQALKDTGMTDALELFGH